VVILTGMLWGSLQQLQVHCWARYTVDPGGVEMEGDGGWEEEGGGCEGMGGRVTCEGVVLAGGRN